MRVPWSTCADANYGFGGHVSFTGIAPFADMLIAYGRYNFVPDHRYTDASDSLLTKMANAADL